MTKPKRKRNAVLHDAYTFKLSFVKTRDLFSLKNRVFLVVKLSYRLTCPACRKQERDLSRRKRERDLLRRKRERDLSHHKRERDLSCRKRKKCIRLPSSLSTSHKISRS
jgi:hypothetical protein